MTKIGWVRIDIQDEDERYRVHGFNNMLMTNNLDAALKFIEDQVLATELINGILPVDDIRKDDNS